MPTIFSLSTTSLFQTFCFSFRFIHIVLINCAERFQLVFVQMIALECPEPHAALFPTWIIRSLFKYITFRYERAYDTRTLLLYGF